MEITQSLSDAENALRDFIGNVLFRLLGANWIEQCGVSPDRITKWKERKEAEGSRQRSGVVEERLLYYADFYDIRTILKKHWSGEFSAALGEWKTVEVWLSELEKLRDPDAHRRQLLPHQRHLAIGISGEIRSRIVRYRSKLETPEDCFPRIESARDSLGNIWTPESDVRGIQKFIMTGMTLRPGDKIDYVVTASDPEDGLIEYGRFIVYQPTVWQLSNEIGVIITETDIGLQFSVRLVIRSTRSYHASGIYDDEVAFCYRILPTNKS